MLKKIALACAFLASLPVIYVIGPLFLPYRTVVSIYYHEPIRTQELARLDHIAEVQSESSSSSHR